jgi:PAS domain S-box-containing protein
MQTLSLFMLRPGTVRMAASEVLLLCLSSIVFAILWSTARTASAKSSADAPCWWAIACAVLCWLCADIGVTVQDLLSPKAAFPLVSNFFSIAFYPCAIWGLWRIPKASPLPGETINTLLDAATLVASIIGLAWVLDTQEMLAQLVLKPAFETELIVTYVMLNVLLAGTACWIIIRRLSANISSLPVFLLLMGFGFTILGNWAMASNLVHGEVHGGGLGDFYWMFFLLCLGAAGLFRLREKEQTISAPSERMAWRRSRSTLVLFIIHIWVCVAIFLIVRDLLFPTANAYSPIFPVVMLVITLVGMRQMRGLKENERLNRQIREANVSLKLAYANLVRLNEAIRKTAESTTRHQGEQVKESEEKFTRIFRISPDAIALVDIPSDVFLDVNDALLRIHGLRREDVVGKKTTNIRLWETPEQRSEMISQLTKNGFVRNFEANMCTASGEKLQCLYSADVVEVHGHKAYIAIVRDITDIRRIQEERRRARRLERQMKDDFTRKLIASQETERRRIASELHDSIGQDLLLIANRLRLVQPTDQESALQIRELGELADNSIAEVRRISHDLRPYNLEYIGITRALKSMAENAGETMGFNISVKIDDIDDVFSPEATTNLFRLVQESLNNIMKHAKARNVSILLERDIRDVRLDIVDDGTGFRLENGALPFSSGGLGLRNMAERARILGGHLLIESTPGQGTRITLNMPVPENPRERHD